MKKLFMILVMIGIISIGGGILLFNNYHKISNEYMAKNLTELGYNNVQIINTEDKYGYISVLFNFETNKIGIASYKQHCLLKQYYRLDVHATSSEKHVEVITKSGEDYVVQVGGENDTSVEQQIEMHFKEGFSVRDTIPSKSHYLKIYKVATSLNGVDVLIK